MACRRPDLEVASTPADEEEAAWKVDKRESLSVPSMPPSPQRPTPPRSCGLRLCSFVLCVASLAMLLCYQGSDAHLPLGRGVANEAMREPELQEAPRDLPKAPASEGSANPAAQQLQLHPAQAPEEPAAPPPQLHPAQAPAERAAPPPQLQPTQAPEEPAAPPPQLQPARPPPAPEPRPANDGQGQQPAQSPPAPEPRPANDGQGQQQQLHPGPGPTSGQGQQQPPAAAVGPSFERWIAEAAPAKRQAAVEALVPYIEMEHPTPLQPCDVRPPVKLASDEDCTRAAPGVVTGLRAEGPAFLVDVSVFGFDLDVMEVKLHELNSTVDLFCIIESTFSHHGDSKPLLWARNKGKPRFVAFQHRVFHVIVNESEAADALKGDNIWRFEAAQEAVGLRKLRQHLASLQIPPGRKVVLNFGDADELAMPQNLHLIKHCNPAVHPLGHGAWMPLGRFDRAFQTDFPATPSLPYTFTNPSSWDVGDPGIKRFSGATKSLVGGWHLTNYVYPPFALLKGISNTEASYGGFSPPPEMREPGGLRKWFEGESAMTNYEWTRRWLQRTVPVDTLKLQEPYRSQPELLEPPNVMRCNKERYEAWYGIYDRRLSLPLVGVGTREL